MRRLFATAAFVLILVAAPAAMARAALADPPSLTGHWKGTLNLGGTAVDYDIDFTPKGNGWAGDITIPAQGARDHPLEGISLAGNAVAFRVPGVPGEPSFKGNLSVDGATIKGTFTQGGKSTEFSLSRAVDPAAAMKRSMEGFDAVVDKAIKDFKVPGLAIAVVKDGEVIYARAFGRRDVEKGLPVTPDTLFAIGSCTKAFTTFVMGTLVDEGKLDWDTPVRTYLPGLRMGDPIATESITPRDLVTHRSGLPRHDMVWYNTRLTGKDVFARLAHFEPTEPLRAKFQYNNMMFMLAGYLVENVDGRPWEEAVRARIFGPLGMRSSNFSVLDSQKSDDFARPYDEQEGKVRVIPFRDITNVGPAGSINSSVGRDGPMGRRAYPRRQARRQDDHQPGRAGRAAHAADDPRPAVEQEGDLARLVRHGVDDRHLSRASARAPRRGDRRLHVQYLPVPRRRHGPGRADQQGRDARCPS